MVEQKGYFEEMAEALEAERKVALRRHYDACVANGDIRDTEDAWKGFVYGWYGTLHFQNAKTNYDRAGGEFAFPALFLLGILLITLPLTAIGFAVFADAPIDILRSSGFVLAGVALLLLGLRSVKKARRKVAESGRKFREQWGEKEPASD